MIHRHRWDRWFAAVAALTAFAGCQEVEFVVPEASEVEAHYIIPARSTFSMKGNVAEIEVWQSTSDLRKGGALWAKVGPYVYLFSPATRDALTEFNGLAGIRVITRTPGGTEIARATLLRDALNVVTWKKALGVAGRARMEGRLGLLQSLVSWGEDHTDFRYNRDYAG